MTKEDLNFIKDAFSQIIDDIAGNPDCGDAARAVASDLGTLERKLEKRVTELPSNLDDAAKVYNRNYIPFDQCDRRDIIHTFKAGAKWMAGQFQKIDGDLVDWYSTSDGKDYCCGVKTIEPHEVPEGFYIRKKKEKEDDRRNT